jgi:hypothetical protein
MPKGQAIVDITHSKTIQFPPLESERLVAVKTFLKSMGTFMGAEDGDLEIQEVRIIQVKTTRTDLAIILARVADNEKKKAAEANGNDGTKGSL